MTALQVESLTVADRRGARVVHSMSFSLEAGEILGVLGESGCGKTSMGLALLGYARRGLEITGGSVLINGEEVLGGEATALRGRSIAYVPQDPGTALDPSVLVGRQMEELVSVHSPDLSADERRARVAEVLVEVGLGEDVAWAQRYPHQLSGGQQQRVAIAMGYINRPTVLVMDEPTTGLDVTTQATVLDTVKKMCVKHHTAVVYVTHDIAVISSLASRVLVVYAGKIVEVGDVEAVLSRSRHPYVRALMRAVPELDGAVVEGIGGHAPDPVATWVGCAFSDRCSERVAVCDHVPPPDVQLAGDHRALCHLAEAEGEPPRARIATFIPGGAQRTFPTTVAALEVRDLQAWYGDRQVLAGVSLRLQPGECLAVVGESGSGKSTLAGCIAGIHRRFQGSVMVAGEELSREAKARSVVQRRSVQYVFQNPYAALNPRQSVRASLLQPGRVLGRDESKAVERGRMHDVLDRVHLPRSVLDRRPHDLSGGQRQRVAIARGLMVEPTILLCDEITSALDVSVQATVIAVLRELHEDGLSSVFITHNLALVPGLAHRVAVMSGGRVVETGPTGDVLRSPQADYTASLLHHVPRLGA